MYGKGMQLVSPSPSFVAKTANSQSGQKIFINVCTSEKVCFGKQLCLMLPVLLHCCFANSHETISWTESKPCSVVCIRIVQEQHAMHPDHTVIAGSACTLTCAFVITMNEDVSSGTELYSMPVAAVTRALLHRYSLQRWAKVSPCSQIQLPATPSAHNSTSFLLADYSTICRRPGSLMLFMPPDQSMQRHTKLCLATVARNATWNLLPV